MAFKRTLAPTFKTEVTVMVANDKGGFDKNTFTGEFKRPTSDEAKLLRPLGNEDVARRQLVGWEMRDDETKELVPFTEDAKEWLLSISPAPMAVALAFWEAVNGARSKN